MREMASLSGLMLKLLIVWLMSYMIDGVSLRVCLFLFALLVGVPWRDLRREAFWRCCLLSAQIKKGQL